MSFAFMPLYTGDYQRDTAHLDCAEHGIYLLFLQHCWDQKGPLPHDERKLLGICRARSGSEIEAMRRVLAEFFVRMDDGWYNHRMQREIERASVISLKRKSAGAKGYQAKAKHLLSKSQASATTLTPTPTTTTTTTPSTTTTKSKAKATPRASLATLPDWLPHEAWNAFVEMRLKIRAPMTEYAKVLMMGKLNKFREQGLNLELLLNNSTAHSWRDVYMPDGGVKSATSAKNQEAVEVWLSKS